MENIQLIPMKKLFFEYKQQNYAIKKLKTHNEALFEENKRLNDNLKELNEQLHETINRTLNNDNIHLLCIKWKEKNLLLLNEIEKAKQEKEILVKHYEEKISFYKDEIEKEKNKAKISENEFIERLQVQQASTALQTDELESRWQARLDIVSQQFKDSNVSCNVLRNQLAELKNRFSFANSESEKRILELEQSLVIAEEKVRTTEGKLINSQQYGVPVYGASKSNVYTRSKPYTYAVKKPDNVYKPVVNISFDSSVKSYEPLQVNSTVRDSNKSDSQIVLENPPKRSTKRKLYNVDEFQ